MKGTVVIIAFGFAVVFFLLAALSVDIGDVLLVPAGLTALASGMLIERLP